MRNHGWRIEDWKEVDFLVQDIELTDKVLLRLAIKIRRNLLAAIQHYQRDDLAEYLNCANSSVTNILDYTVKKDVKELYLLPLARFLDAPYWCIRLNSYEDQEIYGDYFDVKSISMKEFVSEINDEPDTIRFLKIHTSQEYFIKENYLYVKVLPFSNFKVVEVMGLNYDKDEIHDFIKYCIRDHVGCIIVTPAILRKTKKVIYVLKACHEEDPEEMINYISAMKKRKFTRIIALNNRKY
jgi:hypothetical protein